MQHGLKRSLWSAATTSSPVAAKPGRDFGARSYLRPVAGLGTVLVIATIVVLAVAMFNGAFVSTVPVTVMADRAGLLLDRGARVKLNGAQIGTVSHVKETADGQAELTLAIDPGRLAIVPDNALVEIGANTVFGAKSVEFSPPPEPSGTPLRAGQIINSRHVTVEVNTIFEDLDAVLSHIEPAKLNETLGSISAAMAGRGEAFGQSLTDLNGFLGTIEPALPALDHELQTLPQVATTYADAGPDFMTLIGNAARISQTLTETHSDLDRFLVSSIGLSDIGNDVIGSNRQGLTDLMQVLIPTTDLTNRYREALTCSLTGIVQYVLKPPGPLPGVNDLGALTLGIDRYRYPQDLPKVAATGGPQCKGQLPLQFNTYPPKLIADVGTDPTRYGNQGIVLNSDGLKQILFGPIDGPPRNTAQIGQPG